MSNTIGIYKKLLRRITGNFNIPTLKHVLLHRLVLLMKMDLNRFVCGNLPDTKIDAKRYLLYVRH